MFNYQTTLGQAEFDNPIFTASGCAGSGKELSQFFDLNQLGAVVTKSIMLKARSGRATPRMAETPSGMLNSIGLQGPGIDLFLENDVPWLLDQGATIVVSIAGESVEDYAVLARKIRAVHGISALEVNISCPNVENRGQVFACHPETARAGADARALINTGLGMVRDTNTKRPKLAGKTGGLSGPAIRPIAVRAIYQVHAAMPHVKILGMGGISSGQDAFELILAGASAVSIGTATFGNPMAAMKVKEELRDQLISHGFDSLREAVGYAHRSEGNLL